MGNFGPNHWWGGLATWAPHEVLCLLWPSVGLWRLPPAIRPRAGIAPEGRWWTNNDKGEQGNWIQEICSQTKYPELSRYDLLRSFDSGNIDPGKPAAEVSQEEMTYSWKKNLSRPCPSLDTPHLTLHTALFALQTSNFTLHTSHFTLHTSHFSLLPSHSKPHTSHFTLRSSHSKLKLHTPHFTLHTPHFTHLTASFTLQTSHFTLHTAVFALQT